MTSLPQYQFETVIADFRDSYGNSNIILMVETTGILRVVRGSGNNGSEGVAGTTLVRTDTPAVVAHSFQHIEMKVHFDSSAGSVEIRVNGVTVINESSINTVASNAEQDEPDLKLTPEALCAEINFPLQQDTSQSNEADSSNPMEDRFLADVIVWDDSGANNNDFIGDHFVSMLVPTADTAQADWTPTSGSGFEKINDRPGSDRSDTDYLYAGVPGSPTELKSEFDIENLNSTAGSVAAVATGAFLRKTQAGKADFQFGIVQGGSESKGPVHQIASAYNYFEDVFEVDPSSGVAFTPTDVNSLKLQLNRVT
jgi:hypothetical protein